MEHLGLSLPVKNIPALDSNFVPLAAFWKAYREKASRPLAIVVEAGADQRAVLHMRVHGTPDMAAADAYMVDRLVKTLLWQKGGHQVTICGSQPLFEQIASAYRPGGSRAFDAAFMARVYEQPFSVHALDYAQTPQPSSQSVSVGRHLDGCRIGFDAGGSDRKVSAVIDGEAVFSEEVVWLPKEQADPDYHYQGILEAFRAAAARMPRVDGIGISSAGIYINNRTMVASLFLKVPDDLFKAKVKDIFIRAAREIGPDIPVVVCNDGDVSALAGAMSLDSGEVLGLAMGTSEAGGYVDEHGNITGWLNELAFVPVDANPEAMADEWSGDIGCGVKYFSQDGVIKLAPQAGIDLSAAATPAGKLKIVQKQMEAGDERAAAIYKSIGCYLAHGLAWYNEFYKMKHVLLLGRVMSGKGGDLILEEAKRVLADEYPEVTLLPALPDEKFRRIGQSVAAASLPDIRKRG